MEIDSLVSIIVPVYNSEKYIHKCIKSIITQSYKNIELILIDDGSTDKSGEICDYYSKIDTRVIVNHKENEGATIARNIGLKSAKGNYIAFVDSDDWIEKNYISNMISIITKKDYDLVICNYKEVYLSYENSNYINRRLEYSGEVNIDKRLEPTLFINGLIHPCWGKLYKASIIKENNLDFINIKLSEDTVFNLKYLKLCKSIYILEDSLYFYVHYDNHLSITSKVYENVFENYLIVHEHFNKYLDRYEEYIYNDVINKTMYAQYYNSFIKILMAPNIKQKRKKEILDNALNNDKILETFKVNQNKYKVNFINNMIINKQYILLKIIFKSLKIK